MKIREAVVARVLAANPELDMLLPSEVALLLRQEISFVYDHRVQLGGFKNGRSVRFPVPGLLSYLRERSGAVADRPALGTRKATRARIPADGPSDHSLMRSTRLRIVKGGQS